MPQSVGYGEAEILRVGIRPVEALPTERLPPAHELRSRVRPWLGPGHKRRSRDVSEESGLPPTPESLRHRSAQITKLYLERSPPTTAMHRYDHHSGDSSFHGPSYRPCVVPAPRWTPRNCSGRTASHAFPPDLSLWRGLGL